MKEQKSSLSNKEIKVKTPVAFAQSNKVEKREATTHESIFPSK